jgi:hypothetical protein
VTRKVGTADRPSGSLAGRRVRVERDGVAREQVIGFYATYDRRKKGKNFFLPTSKHAAG